MYFPNYRPPSASSTLGTRFMGGIRQLGRNISSAPSRIARDFRHATGMEPFTGAAKEDYDRRTQASLARFAPQNTKPTGSGRGAELTDAIQGAGLNPNQFREMNEAQKNFIMMTNPRLKEAFSRHPDSQGHNFETMPSGFGSGDTGGGGDTSGGDTGGGDTGGGGTQTNQALMNRMRMQQEQDARARNMDLARMMFERQNMMSPGPIPRQMRGLGAFRNPFVRPMPQPMSYGERENQQMMFDRRMREQPTQYGGQAQQVSQANFAGDQQMQPPPEEMAPGFGGQGVMDQQATAENIEDFRMPPEMAPGFGGQGVQPAVMPPEEMPPGFGGQGVQPNQGGSAAQARQLMLSGDVAGAMRMLKGNVGMEDTSLKSADALQYMQKTGDQAGAEQILKSSVGLPAQQQQNSERSFGVFPGYGGRENQQRQMDTQAQGNFQQQQQRFQQQQQRQPPVGNMRAIRMPAVPGKGGRGVMPQPMPYNPASSPAFRYAGRNYGRLGGMQRTMPRPMEMMSQRERQQIGRIADSFPPRRRGPIVPMQNPYVGILQRGISSKGGGRTMPQRPPMSGKGGGRSGYQGMPSFMSRDFGSPDFNTL